MRLGGRTLLRQQEAGDAPEVPVRDGSSGRGRGMLMFTDPSVGSQWTYPWPRNTDQSRRNEGDPRSPGRVREEFEDSEEVPKRSSPKRIKVVQKAQEVPACVGNAPVRNANTGASQGTDTPRIPTVNRTTGESSRRLNLSLNALSTSVFNPGGSQNQVSFAQETEADNDRTRRERSERKKARRDEAENSAEIQRVYDKLESNRRKSQAELEHLDAQCAHINEQLNQLALARDSSRDDNMVLKYQLEYEERELIEKLDARREEAEREEDQFEVTRRQREQEQDAIEHCTTELLAERNEQLRENAELRENIRQTNATMMADRECLVLECAKLEARRSILEGVVEASRLSCSRPNASIVPNMDTTAVDICASTPKAGILKRRDYDPFVSNTAHIHVSDGVYRRTNGVTPGGRDMGSSRVGWEDEERSIGNDSQGDGSTHSPPTREDDPVIVSSVTVNTGRSDPNPEERRRIAIQQSEVELRQLRTDLTAQCLDRFHADADRAREILQPNSWLDRDAVPSAGQPSAAASFEMCDRLLEAAHASGDLESRGIPYRPPVRGDGGPPSGVPPPPYRDRYDRGREMGPNDGPRRIVASGSNDPDPGGDPDRGSPPPRSRDPRRDESGNRRPGNQGSGRGGSGSGAGGGHGGGSGGGSGGPSGPGGGDDGNDPSDDEPDRGEPRRRKRPTRRSSMSARMQDHYENNPAIRDLGLDCYSRGADGSDVVDWSVKQVNRLRFGRMNAARMVAVIPKPYDGSRSWKDWFADFTDDMESNGWGPAEALQQLLRCLREGPGKLAKDRWRRKYGAEGTYAQLVECASYALCHLVCADPMVAFRKRTQKPQESHRAFGLELQNLLERAKPNADFDDVDFLDDLFSHFVRGLRDEQQSAAAERAWNAESSLTDLFMAIETHNKKRGLLAGKVPSVSAVRGTESVRPDDFEVVEVEEEDGSISVVRFPVGGSGRKFIPRKTWPIGEEVSGAVPSTGGASYVRRPPWTPTATPRPTYASRAPTVPNSGTAESAGIPKPVGEPKEAGAALTPRSGAPTVIPAELVDAFVRQLRESLSVPRAIDRAMVRCFRCQQLGHYAGDCVAAQPTRAAPVMEVENLQGSGN